MKDVEDLTNEELLKEKEIIEKEFQNRGFKDEAIKIPIYFTENDGKIKIDEEGIYEELKKKLIDIKENPKKFLEV